MDTDSLWYKDAIIYQLHIKSYRDSNADGFGDFRGLIEKLDYIQQLGANTIWLLPFYPSPLKDDGYDIAAYEEINPTYGTIEDFRAFLEAAHSRGIRVITELVINHTSDQHPWFQRARRAPKGSPERNWYVWSDDPNKYAGARIIFTDTEKSNWSWDPEAQQFYWHRFFSHQPDLNFDNPDVLEAVKNVMRFWLRMGVDGLRLDAIPYLVEREGTNCENLPETHEVLRALRRTLDAEFPGSHLPRRGQSVAERRARVFRRLRRMSHGVSLSRHAAHVHGAPQGRSHADRRHHAADAGDSARLSVGDLSAQPRRAHARDGDRRRARLHVSRVRARSAHAHQRRHSAPARLRSWKAGGDRSS